MNHRSAIQRWVPALTLACLAVWAPASQAQDGHRDHRGGGDRGDRGGPQHDARGGRAWVDRGHGHNHAYPNAGVVVVRPPQQARPVVWGGVDYRFHQGVWYAPGPRGYAVVRPPRGVWVSDLPLWRTVVLIGGVSYLYLNSTYYRERQAGGYEVVDAPVAATGGAGYVNLPPSDKVFVYPRKGQSAQQQASDEYDCHRWAINQTGFDPSAVATGQPGGQDAERRSDYQRARGACLDARGYTVK